mgnify:CR=1 FL=1
MPEKTIKKKSSGLARATIIIALFSLLAKLLGLLRNNIFTATFGAGDTLDVYFAAFRLPDFLYNLLILGTLSAALIPVFIEYLVKDEEEAWKIVNSVLNIIFLTIASCSAILAVFAPHLGAWIAPGFSAEKKAAMVELTRIMMLTPILFSLSSIFSSVLNSFKRFTLVAAVPLFYNLSVIFGVLVLYPIFGIKGLAYGVVLGAFLHMFLQIPSLVSVGYRWRPVVDVSSAGFRKIAKMFIPRIFSMDAGQIGLLIATVIGSSLASGSIAVYNLASDLQAIPLGIVAVSFAIAAFPYLSEAVAKKDNETYKEVFNGTLSQILFVIIPVSALMIVLRAQIVRLAYGRGELFDWQATIATLTVFGVFALSLFAQSLVPLLARAFYALHNTLIPVIAGLVSIAVNIIAAIFFIGFFPENLKVVGLATAFSVSAIVNFLILFVWLEFKFGNLVDRQLIFKLEKILIGTLLAGIACYAALFSTVRFVDNHTYLGLFTQTIVALAFGLAVYLAAGYALNLAEVRHLITWVKIWMRKLRSAFVKSPGGI